ncbi:hypothetical protein B4113_2644 [Geobacillus sp. B4113_201601]|nr:hypothetical protein B4113_2644 [Geobacillus sp. B4113_201601]
MNNDRIGHHRGRRFFSKKMNSHQKKWINEEKRNMKFRKK